ncbi:MAG: phosphotriesterase family protein [Acidimicrobiales bacterium]
MTSETQLVAINTVRGNADPSSLGAVLMHEHLFVITAELPRPLAHFEPEKAVTDAVTQLSRLKACGIDTLVDLTVPGLGRRIDLMSKVAAMSPVQLIAATGWYTYSELPPYFQLRTPRNGDPERDVLTDLFVRELTVGIDGTDIRAAVIKCVTDRPGMTPDVRRILRAAAAAHRRTGATIMTHADSGTRRGLEQVELLADEGVDLTRVVIGHCGDSTDMAYLEALIEKSVLLGMDRFGLSHLLDTQQRLRTVALLVAEGARDQLVLSHDAAVSIDWVDLDQRERHFNEWRFDYLPTQGLPALRSLGVSEEDLTVMLRQTPRRLLTWPSPIDHPAHPSNR